MPTSNTEVAETTETAVVPFPPNPDFDAMHGDDIDSTVVLTEQTPYTIPPPSTLATVDAMLAAIEKGLPALPTFPTVAEIEESLVATP